MRFKRFTKRDFLEGIGRALLGQFFDRYKGPLAERGIALPSPALEDGDYYEALAKVARSPEGLPDDLFEAFYAVEGMATVEGQERLERAVEQGELGLKFDAEATRGDIAMQAFLCAPELVAQKNNELRLARLSSFEYYGCKAPVDRRATFAAPSAETRDLITADLDAWFKENNRGEQTVFVEPYEIDGEHWFLVRHGDTFARMAKLEKGKLKMLHFRPAKDDVVVYSPEWDQVRIHAGTKREKELYRTKFGLRLFNDPEYFSERKAFTLEPLRTQGVTALDWTGAGDVEWIRLREYEIAFGGGFNDAFIRKSDDIFAAAEARQRPAIPDGGRLVRAVFEILFTGGTKPRRVQVRLPSDLKLGRYCDAAVIQRWFSEKEFRETVKAAGPGVAPFPLPILQPPPRFVVPVGGTVAAALAPVALSSAWRSGADSGPEHSSAE